MSLRKISCQKNIGVSFVDIGALENVNETLKELIVVPLQRPELLSKWPLLKVFVSWYIAFKHIVEIFSNISSSICRDGCFTRAPLPPLQHTHWHRRTVTKEPFLYVILQDYSMRYPLIQGHDPPAAMWYTDCRFVEVTPLDFFLFAWW